MKGPPAQIPAVVAAIAAQCKVDPAAVRIELGRRIIYGQVKSKEFREELTPDRQKIVTDALSSSAEAIVNPIASQKATPSILIRANGEPVFRQEPAGIIINQIQPVGDRLKYGDLPENQPLAKAAESLYRAFDSKDPAAINQAAIDYQMVSALEAIAIAGHQDRDLRSTDPSPFFSTRAISASVAVVSGHPIGQLDLLLNSKSLPLDLQKNLQSAHDLYQLQSGSKSATIEIPTEPLDVTLESELQQLVDSLRSDGFSSEPAPATALGDTITQALESYQSDQQPHGDPVRAVVAIVDSATALMVPLAGHDPIVPMAELEGNLYQSNGEITTVTDCDFFLVRSDDPALQDSTIGTLTLSTVPTVAQVAQAELTSDIVHVPPQLESLGSTALNPTALSVLNAQLDRIEDSPSKTFLTSLTANLENQAKQTVSQVVRGAASATNWLMDRAENLRNHAMAHTAMQILGRGQALTQESSYTIKGYTIARTPSNQFTISDDKGVLMQFQVGKIELASLRPRVEMQQISPRLQPQDFRAFRTFRTQNAFPQGDPQIAQQYQQQCQSAAETARQYLALPESAQNLSSSPFVFAIDPQNTLTIASKSTGYKLIEQSSSGQLQKATISASQLSQFARLSTQIQSFSQPTTADKSNFSR